MSSSTKSGRAMQAGAGALDAGTGSGVNAGIRLGVSGPWAVRSLEGNGR
jgi:hypothetical protein